MKMSPALNWNACQLFCLCMKYPGNCWTDLCQIYREDVFGPSLRWVWMSRSKVKVTTDKNGVFSGYLGNCWMDLQQIHMEHVFHPSLGTVWRSRSISVACVRFMFGKTSLLQCFECFHISTPVQVQTSRSGTVAECWPLVNSLSSWLWYRVTSLP